MGVSQLLWGMRLDCQPPKSTPMVYVPVQKIRLVITGSGWQQWRLSSNCFVVLLCLLMQRGVRGCKCAQHTMSCYAAVHSLSGFVQYGLTCEIVTRLDSCRFRSQCAADWILGAEHDLLWCQWQLCNQL